jgi:hypothetical protein
MGDDAIQAQEPSDSTRSVGEDTKVGQRRKKGVRAALHKIFGRNPSNRDYYSHGKDYR